jgi:molecular chaperone GrpE
MTPNDGKGSFSADIPQSILDEALEAVEKRKDEAGGEVVPIGAEGAPAAAADPAQASEVERLRAELALSQEKAREVFEKLREEHDRLLRAVADLDNYKKRAARERDEMQKFAVEKLVKDLFPVVDNLDRALAAAPEGDPLSGGVKLVLKSLEDALARHGVKSFQAMGEAFDPRVHEAIMNVPAGDRAPGTVVLQHGRGFTLHERLVRPALVGVAASAADGDEA